MERKNRRRITLHAVRVILFLVILALIRKQHAEFTQSLAAAPPISIKVEQVANWFPSATSLSDPKSDGRREILDSNDDLVGYAIQTSPQSDELIGFSGPTNTLIAFDADDRIVGIDVLSSRDTREHVTQVLEDQAFMSAFDGMTWEQAATNYDLDAVSGATLTSVTIQESIIMRLSGGRPSLKFAAEIGVAEARALFESAETVERDDVRASYWHVLDAEHKELGTILRTSPSADHIVGYQGPTDTLIGMDPAGRVAGISLGKSFDNDEYVTYVRDDKYFLTLFNDLVLEELHDFISEPGNVEGVSGATMTSMAVADGLLLAATDFKNAKSSDSAATAKRDRATSSWFRWQFRDIGTAFVIVAGLLIAFTRLRGNRWLRIAFQLVLIGYLGLINGDMVSQAMLAGWAQTSVPWGKARGLVMLTAAAFLVPIFTRRNAYCSHLCPHGAVQDLIKNRVPWQIRIPGRVQKVLKCIPAALLVWCVVVATAHLAFSLVDIEPFDAWVFRVAGWATIAVAIVGLVGSLFVPMAYCRYGCPTGALLGFLRFNSKSDEWSLRDWFAVLLVVLTVGLVYSL